jgi:ankyrin repeat protein
LTEEDVAAVERGLKATLPADYRAFILKHNGGGLLPEGPGIEQLFPLRKIGDQEGTLFDVCYFTYKVDHPHLPERMVAIGDSCGHYLYCLSLSGPDRGAVYQWEPPDPGLDDEELLKREADSFTDFMAAVARRSEPGRRKKKSVPEWVGAIQRQDLAWLTEWLHSGPDPLAESYGDRVTPIRLAVGEGKQRVVELFLAHGGKAIVNEAFESALVEEKYDVAASLLRQVDREYVERAMVDHVRETEFVRQMLDAGADPNCAADLRVYKRRPLPAAAERNAPQTVRLLLERGASPGVWDLEPEVAMALHYAIRGQDLELAKLLMEAGEDLYAPPPGGERSAEDRAKEMFRKKVPKGPGGRPVISEKSAMALFGRYVGQTAAEELRATGNTKFIAAVEAHAAALGQRPRAA